MTMLFGKDVHVDNDRVMLGCNPTDRPMLSAAMIVGKHAANLPPEPAEYDGWFKFTAPDIFTNNSEGSCVECEEYNERAAIRSAALGKAVRFSSTEVHRTYRIQSGGRDTGLDLGTSLAWHVKNPIIDLDGGKHFGSPYGSLDISDLATIFKAGYYFCGLKIAIAASQIMRYSANAVVTGLRKSNAIDHCVAIVGVKIFNGKRYAIVETWGMYLYICIDDHSLPNILGEAWFRYEDNERLSPAGKTVEGFDRDELLREFEAFSGGSIA